jgi:hypothetical protein
MIDLEGQGVSTRLPFGHPLQGNDCRIDRADRDVGDPIGMYASPGERLVTGLVGPERTRALQHRVTDSKGRCRPMAVACSWTWTFMAVSPSQINGPWRLDHRA